MWRMRRELLIPSDAPTILSLAMGGAYVYVGKSRLRRKFRLKKQTNKQVRRLSPRFDGNGEFTYDALPVTDIVTYASMPVTEIGPLPPKETHLDTLSVDSFGTSGSSSSDEEAIPLIELRPHSGSFSKMPFGPFKKMQEEREAARKAAEEEEAKKKAEEEAEARRIEEEKAAEEARLKEEEERKERERLAAEEAAREKEKAIANGVAQSDEEKTGAVLCCVVM